MQSRPRSRTSPRSRSLTQTLATSCRRSLAWHDGLAALHHRVGPRGQRLGFPAAGCDAYAGDRPLERAGHEARRILQEDPKGGGWKAAALRLQVCAARSEAARATAALGLALLLTLAVRLSGAQGLQVK